MKQKQSYLKGEREMQIIHGEFKISLSASYITRKKSTNYVSSTLDEI